MHSQQPQLDIAYPTTWVYRIIGEDESALRTAAAEIVEPRAHEIELSNTSKSKRYVSLKVRVRVEDEVSRVSIFERLRAADAVKIVL